MKPKPSPREMPSWMALVVFVLLIVLFYWKVFFAHEVLVFIDSSRFFFPMWKWASGFWRQGTIPLWNHSAQFGTPYFADPQMAAAYPPVALFYSCFYPVPFSALIILHHLWALFGAWTFARAQGFTTRVALFGAVVFGFSLHVVCAAWTPPALMAISWLPWVFWAAQKLYQSERGGLLYLSIAWAMQLAAGYPVLAYLTGLALLLHFGWRSMGKGGGRFAWVGWFALAVLIATGYNLSWGLPFIDLFRLSNYQNGANHFQDLGIEDLGTFLDPFAQGHPTLSTYTGPLYWVSTYFMGLPVLCLVIWGAWKRVYCRISPVLFFVYLFLSLGLGSSLARFFPSYGLVVHSGLWVSILCLFAAWMAMEALVVFLPSGNKIENLPWVGAVGLVFGAAFLLQKPHFSLFFVASLVFVLGAVVVRSSWTRWIFLMAALVLSLGPAAISLNITFDRSFYEQPPEMFSKLGKPGRLFFSPLLLTSEAAYLQGRDMEDAYRTAKEKCFPDWPLGFGREEVPVYNTLRLRATDDWTNDALRYSPGHSRQVLDFLGARYVIGNVRFKDFRLVTVNPVQVSENPSALPVWSFSPKAIPSGPTLQDDFEKASKMGLNYGKNCFIEDPTKVGTYSTSSRILKAERSLNGIDLSVDGKGRSLLISSETDHPGWKVWVDGKSAVIEHINHAFRGVVLKDGEGHVQFRYRPVTFRFGLFSALLVCGAWLAMGLLRLRNER